MKRREMLKMAPLSIACIAGLSRKGLTEAVNGMPVTGIPGKLAKQYHEKTCGMLKWIRETQSEDLLETSHLMAKTIMDDRTVWTKWDQGHSTGYDVPAGRHGLPKVLTIGYSPDRARKGDMILINRGDIAESEIEKHNLTVVGAPAPWSKDAKMDELIVHETAQQRIRPKADIWIETQVTTLGAVIHIPGMPAPTGPISGILGQTTMWMMIADTCRILARNGKSVSVGGDEPKLGDNTTWVNLFDPLMDNYFDQVIRQIEMIWAEMGSIRKIATMAVDAVLAGGKFYGYSTYKLGLAAEAQTRRGGLTLSRGATLTDGKVTDYNGKPIKGSAKDIVVIGIIEPDNSEDLKALDQFRRMNMKIVSIGPMTRNIKIPDGRTVPKETEVHVGRMTDTFGLFAVPGFERRICPTSGPLQVQIWWMLCMEIADEIIRRTGGNVPGAFYSAAIEGGMDHMNLMNEWWQERGY